MTQKTGVSATCRRKHAWKAHMDMLDTWKLIQRTCRRPNYDWWDHGFVKSCWAIQPLHSTSRQSFVRLGSTLSRHKMLSDLIKVGKRVNWKIKEEKRVSLGCTFLCGKCDLSFNSSNKWFTGKLLVGQLCHGMVYEGLSVVENWLLQKVVKVPVMKVVERHFLS